MIFDFDEPRRVTMWMENTILPLDMLFADDTGTIRHIKEKAVPYSRDIIDSTIAVKYVVELNAKHRRQTGNQAGRQDRQRHDDEEDEVMARTTASTQAALRLSRNSTVSGY